MSQIYDSPITTLATVTRPTTTLSTTTRRRGQKLTNEQKFYIAELLGCYLTPSQVAREFEEYFGMAISPQAVQCYDPTKRAGAHLSRKLLEVFVFARGEYRMRIENIAVAHIVVRLQMLGDAATTLYEKENYLAMALMLEQAAKEVGGWYRR